MKYGSICNIALGIVLLILSTFSRSAAQDSTTSALFKEAFKSQMLKFDSISLSLRTVPVGPSPLDPDMESALAKKLHSLTNWRSVFYPYGDLESAIKADSTRLAKSAAGAFSNCNNAQWYSVGPKGDPQNVTGQQVTGVKNGRLDCIAFKPEDPNILYVGSGVGGGLWKVNGTTGAAVHLNTDNLVPNNGVSAIAAIPGRIVIATGSRYGTMWWSNWTTTCQGRPAHKKSPLHSRLLHSFHNSLLLFHYLLHHLRTVSICCSEEVNAVGKI